MNYKISVIVPVYNVSEYIVNCLNSIARQDYAESFECILVDDCGTDNSIELVEEFIAHYSGKVNFRLVSHDNNRGLSAARNTGINCANGDYVLFVDSDDELKDNCLTTLSEPLQKEPFDFIFANYEVICSWTDMNLSLAVKDGPVYGQQNIADIYHWGWFSSACNKLICLDFLKKNSLFFKENLIHEDELWSFQLACVANSMYIINKYTYTYFFRRNGGSIMSDLQSHRHLDAYLQVAESMTSFMKTRKIKHNDNLCKVVEWVKYNRCISLSMSSEPFAETFRLYKYLRSIDFERPKPTSLSIKERILAFHNILPLFLGFLWNYLSRCISSFLVSMRHSSINIDNTKNNCSYPLQNAET